MQHMLRQKDGGIQKVLLLLFTFGASWQEMSALLYRFDSTW